jgi:hypothetical protein
VSVAAGVLLVVTQLLGALAFVVVDGDPTRRARSALVGVNGLLTLLAVYLLLGLVGLYAQQQAASGTLGLVGFLVAVLGTMLLAGGTVSFGVLAVGWVLFGLASVRARGFPRDAALLLVIGGGIGVLIAVVPGAGAPLALAVAWRGTWLLRSDRGGQVELVPPR